ncbi:VPLPA-CTERM sorting domain-containing protein [Hyphococcus luteus]|nr:VPLPA-CTERM sorting domain-containing protein [Marinicaulis flavus]
MNLKYALAAAASLCGVCGVATTASAAEITLELIDSYDRADPFGLAYDGTHIWWADNGGVIRQMTTDGVDTGVSFSGPVWSELAWDGSQLIMTQNNTVYFFDRDGSNMTTQTITAAPYTGILGLNDGLDWDNGELWISPDIGNVYRMEGDLSAFVGASPFLGGGGGYSGVERIQATNGTDYVIVVNDASSPRELCVHTLGGVEIGCQAFSNSRYEGLAFDGRYLWAADYFGDRIDKYDILSDGGSIIDPGVGEVPLPAALPLMLLGLGGLGAAARRKKKA